MAECRYSHKAETNYQNNLEVHIDQFQQYSSGQGSLFLRLTLIAFIVILIDYSRFARSASVGSDVIIWSLAAAYAVLMARKTFTVRIEFTHRTDGNAVRPVFNVFTLCTILRARTGARFIAFVMTMFTKFWCRFVNAQVQVTTLDAGGTQLFISAGQTLVRSESPATLR